MRVLVADDDGVSRRFLERTLTTWDHDISKPVDQSERRARVQVGARVVRLQRELEG